MSWYKIAKEKEKWSWLQFLKGLGISTALLPAILFLNLSQNDIKSINDQNGGDSRKTEKQVGGMSGQIPTIEENLSQTPQMPVPTHEAPEAVVDTTGAINEQRLVSTLIRHEGARNWVYDDATGRRLYPGQEARGNRTVGVGLNLERSDARQKLENIGADAARVYSGQDPITNEQIESLLVEDIEMSTQDAMNFVGRENFNQQPTEIKETLINMAFNLGGPRLNKFVKLRTALQQFNYQEAAKEMLDSRWAEQVGNRSSELADIVRSTTN